MKRKTTTVKIIASVLCCVMITGCLAGCQGKDTSNAGESNTEASAESESSSKYQKSIDNYVTKLEEIMEQEGVPSASLSITENGETIYDQAFGYANAEQKIQADSDTLFFTGSVGKVYTTAAMLKLAEDQGISLDDPVEKYLPEFQMDDSRYKDITLRMLLNHSAGLPSDLNATQMSAGSLLPEETNIDIFEALRSQTLRSNPGEYAVYSNIGFQIIHKIIEKLSGQTYSDYLKENFFEPLKLENTYMASSENEDVAEDRFALPVDENGNTLPREYSSRSLEGTGGIVSTTEDLCKFIDGILSVDTGILSEQSITELRKDQSLTANFPEQQSLNGLGWDQINRFITETQVFQKGGGTTNCSSYVATAPDAGITISVSFEKLLYPFNENDIINLMREILAEKGAVTDKTEMPTYPAEAAANEDDSVYSGIYNGADGVSDTDSLYKVETKENTLQYSKWDGVEWQSIGEYTSREDGSYGFYDEEGKVYTSYSFQTVGDDVYLLKREMTPEYDTTTAIAKLLPTKEASAAWEQYNNSLWLRTNIWPTDYQAIANVSFLQTWEELPGYVVMNGMVPVMEIKDDTRLSSISNQVSGSGYADVISNDEGFSWIGMDFISSDTVSDLPVQDTTVSFEEAGTVQWYYVPQDTEINLDATYNQIRVLTLSPELEPFYDNMYDSGQFTALAGSYIGLTSAAPTEIDISISPVQ
ncbi:MAG: serine hydrolase domain-containing protein [Lachnospiraceae bacterium]